MTLPIPSLDTARFTLRHWRASDIPDLLDLDDDPAVTRYVGLIASRPEREAQWRDLIGRESERAHLCVRLRDSGEFIGWAFLRPFRDASGDWELGYRLRKAWWGQGVGTEVAGSLMAWGWAQPEISVIGAVYEIPNIASRAIMLRVGMHDAGTRNYGDEGRLPYCEARRAEA